MKRFARLATAMALGLFLPITAVQADTYPSRPITVYSPLGPGAPQDVIIRAMADIMAKDLGQPVIVENKPGAALTLAPATMAANAKPDGYTLSAVVSTLVLVNQMSKVAYDPMQDFTYIAQVAGFPLGVTIKSDAPHKSWEELIAFAKANPGKVTYGSPGAGTNAHLGMELVLKHAGVKMTHVPHQGPMPIIPAVLGGHVMLQVSGMEWKPHVEQGGMRLLTMMTAKRHPAFPDAPTIGEMGYPFDVEVPMGFAGPKGMHAVVVKKLHDAFKKASDAPSVQELYKKFDIDHRYASGDDFKKLLETIGQRMQPLIKELGLQTKS